MSDMSPRRICVRSRVALPPGCDDLAEQDERLLTRVEFVRQTPAIELARVDYDRLDRPALGRQAALTFVGELLPLLVRQGEGCRVRDDVEQGRVVLRLDLGEEPALGAGEGDLPVDGFEEDHSAECAREAGLCSFLAIGVLHDLHPRVVPEGEVAGALLTRERRGAPDLFYPEKGSSS
jgi:hypothetical protein